MREVGDGDYRCSAMGSGLMAIPVAVVTDPGLPAVILSAGLVMAHRLPLCCCVIPVVDNVSMECRRGCSESSLPPGWLFATDKKS